MPTAAPMHRLPGTMPRRDYRQERTFRQRLPGQPQRLTLSSSAAWQRARAWVLQRQPLCVDPYSVHGASPVVAVEVDHIVALIVRPDLLVEPMNLQALCHACHARKSGQERRGGCKMPHGSRMGLSKS
jgi:5-methylcytosine-specific restriction enzyme A